MALMEPEDERCTWHLAPVEPLEPLDTAHRLMRR